MNMPQQRPTPAVMQATDMSSMICYECQKLWFGAGARSRATCECPDCGSRLMLSEATRRSEPQGAAAR